MISLHPFLSLLHKKPKIHQTIRLITVQCAPDYETRIAPHNYNNPPINYCKFHSQNTIQCIASPTFLEITKTLKKTLQNMNRKPSKICGF